jgi:hypothetical protein
MISAIIQTINSNPVTGPPLEFVVFMVFWTLLGLTSFLFFQFNRNAALKRRIWPPFIIIIGVIFASFVWYTSGGRPEVLVFMLPAVALISLLNIRLTRFCQSCGRTIRAQPFSSPGSFCKYCGAKLE